jgi:asparagine synthase (glutamine-hydrolysing)
LAHRKQNNKVCGICGVAFFTRSSEAEARARRMTSAMGHRGPDDEGFLVNDPRAPGLALGMRRLSIIDLEGGHQPIWNESRDIAVVMNGELYNYKEVRERLTRLGHKFKTQSDTEILVHGWEEWGEECLTEVRGMFALAIADFRKHYTSGPVLFLGRDPLGIKPLYYTQSAEGFAFASEVRALRASGTTAGTISQDALTSYFLFGSVSEPVTMFEGVFSLPPGHRMLVYVPDRRKIPRTHPWWDPRRSPAGRDPNKPQDYPAAVKQVRPLLQDAVRAHLIADVPVGLFLSSGLDSGAIAALAAREHPGIQSFTLAFPGTEYDESELTRRVAEQCGTKHEEVALKGDAVTERMEEVLGALDQPSMDGVNTYFASWAARQVGLKVALSGLGGDELFAGYPTFGSVPKLERMAAAARYLPGGVRKASRGAMRGLLQAWMTRDAAAKAAAAWGEADRLPHGYFFARALFSPQDLKQLIEPRFRPSSIGADGTTLEPTWMGWLQRAADEARRMEKAGGVSWMELRCYMAGTLLRDTDSVSMARSLEVRVPMLDTPLVEFMCALPDEARSVKGRQKALLVDALKDLLPTEIVGQRKRTFTLPWEQWMRGALRPKMEASFAEIAAPLKEHAKQAGVQRVWQMFLAGKTTWSRPWAIFVLNEWCRRNIAA